MVSVIEPITSTARLTLERTAGIMPKVLLDVLFGEIVVALAKSQVCEFTLFTAIKSFI